MEPSVRRLVLGAAAVAVLLGASAFVLWSLRGRPAAVAVRPAPTLAAPLSLAPPPASKPAPREQAAPPVAAPRQMPARRAALGPAPVPSPAGTRVFSEPQTFSTISTQ